MSKRIAFELRALLFMLPLVLSSCADDAPPGAPPANPDTSRQATPSGPAYVAVYASGNGDELRALFDAFEAETGTRIQLVTGDYHELIDKASGSGSSPHADILLLQSFAELWLAAERDVFRPGVSPQIAARVAPAFRDAESRWSAVSSHPRVIVLNAELVSSAERALLKNYGSLAESAWRQRLCLSSSNVPGNAALVAHLIRQHGEREAELLVRGFKANLSLAEFDTDRDLIDAIASGRCAIGIAALDEVARARSLRRDLPLDVIVFDEPDALLLDFSGAGIARHADNPDGAALFLSWLSMPSPNALHASLSFEFPVNRDAPLSAALRPFERAGTGDTTAAALGFFLEDARLLAERARYR